MPDLGAVDPDVADLARRRRAEALAERFPAQATAAAIAR
jgi:hypothetical protein